MRRIRRFALALLLPVALCWAAFPHASAARSPAEEQVNASAPDDTQAPPLEQFLDVKEAGAKGDGRTDDTAAIQRALKARQNVLISAGTYIITSPLNVYDHQYLIVGKGATLKARGPLKMKAMIEVYRAHNVTIEGPGTLDGNKANEPKAGRLGVRVGTGSRWVTVKGLTCRNMPDAEVLGREGDGIYVGGEPPIPQDISIIGNTCDANDRQGISLVNCQRVRIVGNTFTNTSGTAPGFGIDIEANHANDVMTDILVSRNTITGNQGFGIGVGTGVKIKSIVARRITIIGNTIKDNVRGELDLVRCAQINASGNHIEHSNDEHPAVSVDDVEDATISGNDIHGGLYGLFGKSNLGLSNKMVVDQNIMIGQKKGGILVNKGVRQCVLSGNSIRNDRTSTPRYIGIEMYDGVRAVANNIDLSLGSRGILLSGSQAVCSENRVMVPDGADSIEAADGSSGIEIRDNVTNVPVRRPGGPGNKVSKNTVTPRRKR